MITLQDTEQELILANNCLANASFVERVEAAAAAGFDSIGLSIQSYRSIVATQATPNEMAVILQANGIRLAELEAIIGFAAADLAATGVLGDGLAYTSTNDLREFWEIARRFEPRHLQVAGSFHTTVLEDDAAERFASLCDDAATVGLTLCLEFVPPSNIPDCRAALRVVRDADRPNGTVNIDSWSHARSGADLDVIRTIPAPYIGLVQLNDGARDPEDPDFINETIHLRRVPGDGEFDLGGLLDAVVATGARPPISVEVMSDLLNRLSPMVAAQRLADGARRVIDGSAAGEGRPARSDVP